MQTTFHDDNGQQLTRQFNKKRLSDRAIDELIGMSRGIVADGLVNQKEAEFLYLWMQKNISFCEDRIINQLYCRIKEMLQDGVLDPDEQKELFTILNEFTGETTVEIPAMLSTSLPLCRPAPLVNFAGMNFCLTGKFVYGPRKICAEVVRERGGEAKSSVSKIVDYLVIGSFCSKDWIHTSYGRKIEKAAEFREKHGRISIISEDHWAEYAFRQ